MTGCLECGLPEEKQGSCAKFYCPKMRTAAPTPERLRQGPVDGPSEVVTYDKEGRGVRSLAPRAVDIIGRMLRRGAITEEMAVAGSRFRADFARARYPTLRAADMAREPGGQGGADLTIAAMHARRRVGYAMDALGGSSSAAGSCLWHVIGLERTIKEWALHQGWNGRAVSEESASGILIAALGVLASHYEKNT